MKHFKWRLHCVHELHICSASFVLTLYYKSSCVRFHSMTVLTIPMLEISVSSIPMIDMTSYTQSFCSSSTQYQYHFSFFTEGEWSNSRLKLFILLHKCQQLLLGWGGLAYNPGSTGYIVNSHLGPLTF